MMARQLLIGGCLIANVLLTSYPIHHQYARKLNTDGLAPSSHSPPLYRQPLAVRQDGAINTILANPLVLLRKPQTVRHRRTLATVRLQVFNRNGRGMTLVVIGMGQHGAIHQRQQYLRLVLQQEVDARLLQPRIIDNKVAEEVCGRGVRAGCDSYWEEPGGD